MVKNYIPERGDIVWIDFNAQVGHEQQKGRRPAMIISHKSYNQKVGLALFCPITSKIKNYSFEVNIELDQIKGAILSDQVKSLDWMVRDIEFIGKSSPEIIESVIERIELLIK
ncbi:MAG: type II toxin-antitoxin system PemK/MazF family toxin [Bacteroidetes bacterium]|nr:type II toxin-antitoxin system PemK/MazF family toxin [Bacteroidota bacterium]